MNTGPMPNGKLQPENIKTYEEIGAWLDAYGESIYGTRGGPLEPQDWGVTTQTADAVYVHVLDGKASEVLVELEGPFASASLVQNDARVAVTREDPGYRLGLPPAIADDCVRVIRLKRAKQ
jgi:alpha-L-fucosidase